MKKFLTATFLVSFFAFQSAAVFAGTPIKGVIIKGGRNPGGNPISAVSDINGLIRFQGLKPGDSYTFNQQEFTVPENGILEFKAETQDGVARVIPFKGNRKGWDGVVKGGKSNPKGSEDGSISKERGWGFPPTMDGNHQPKGGEDGSMKTKKETIVPLGKGIQENGLSQPKSEKGISEKGLSN
jgi:hypothetical protein